MSGRLAPKNRGVNEMTLLIGRTAVGECAVVVLYLLTWVVAYSVVMEFDYRFVLEYFRLGWQGGGELPAAIQMAAIAISLLAAVIVGLVYRQRTGRSKAR